MQYLSPFWLTIKDPAIAQLYNNEQTSSVFKTCLGLTVARAAIFLWAISSVFNEGQHSYFRTTLFQLFVSLLLQIALIFLQRKYHHLNELIIPLWISLQVFSIDYTITDYRAYEFIFYTIFLMNIWYIHLVLSNLNWAITGGLHVLSLLYNVIIYINQSS